MTEHRWSKFWWQDWQADQALRSCSLAARGLWMDMLCIAHAGTPRGHVTINGQPVTPKRLGTLAGVSERECLRLLRELEEAGVFSKTPEGVIFSRRMVRDTSHANEGRQAVEKRWNRRTDPITPPNTPPNRGPTQPPITQEAEAEAEERTTLTGGSAPRAAARPPRSSMGSRLPPDWLPADPGFAGATHATLARFRDYWTAQAGARGRMVDWDATWRNWCRRDAENRTTRPGAKTSAMSTTAQNDELMRLVAEPTPLLRMTQ